MNIKFDSSFLMQNFVQLAKILKDDVPKSYPVTKDNDDKFELKENEVMLLKVYKSKFERDYKVRFNKKYEHLKENDIVRNFATDKQLIDCDILISNKYLHIIFEKGSEAINLSKVIEVFVDARYVVFYTDTTKYTLYLNNIQLVMQVVFIVDVLKNVKIGEEMVGRTIDIAINTYKPE